jgi:hypothetical protein
MPSFDPFQLFLHATSRKLSAHFDVDMADFTNLRIVYAMGKRLSEQALLDISDFIHTLAIDEYQDLVRVRSDTRQR